NTGRIITSAALILIVVTGAFALSEIVMMKYIAFGMIAALIIDATVIRMLLVPAVMQMLGPVCWWAPQWMKRIQERIGLGEAELDDEPEYLTGAPALEPAGVAPASDPAASFAGPAVAQTEPTAPAGVPAAPPARDAGQQAEREPERDPAPDVVAGSVPGSVPGAAPHPASESEPESEFESVRDAEYDDEPAADVDEAGEKIPAAELIARLMRERQQRH